MITVKCQLVICRGHISVSVGTVQFCVIDGFIVRLIEIRFLTCVIICGISTGGSIKLL